MSQTIDRGFTVMSCGDGGSHCDAMHFAEELTRRYQKNHKPLPASSISDPIHLFCIANDYVFSRFVEASRISGDVLLGISTCENSSSITKTFETARSNNITTILLSDKLNEAFVPLTDRLLFVPYEGYAERTQEIHTKIVLAIIFSIQRMSNIE